LDPPCQTENGDVKNAEACPIELETEKVAFLQQMVDAYGLPDVGKAVRCLVNYARDNPDKQEAIFNEVRCLDC
jgi:hypothetical protein